MNVELKLEILEQRTTTTVLVEAIKENTWKLLEVNPLIDKFTYAAELITREKTDGVHELLEITESLDFEHWEAMLPTYYNREVLPERSKKFIAAGGYWQITFGGILSVSIPKNYHLSIDELTTSWGIIPSSSGREEC